MFSNLRNDLRLYRWLIGMQLRVQAQYKLNLVVDIATYLITASVEFAGLLIIFGPFPSILGWKIGEVALLYTIMSIGFGLAELIGAGIDSFDVIIRRGEFDRVLLRPAGAFTQIIGSDFRLRRLGRITQGAFAFLIALHLLPGLHWTFITNCCNAFSCLLSRSRSVLLFPPVTCLIARCHLACRVR